MKAEPAFIRTYCGVHLDPEPAVNMKYALIIDPWHSELDDALGLSDALEDLCLRIPGILNGERDNSLCYLFHCLEEFRLMRIPRADAFHVLVDLTLYFAASVGLGDGCAHFLRGLI